MFTFDHLAICCEDLEAGADWVARTLGAPLSKIGFHPAMSTHNRLLSLGGSEYLEVIAVDPAAPAPKRPRWFDLDNFKGRPRPTNWLLNCPDIEAAVARSPGVGEVLDLERGPYAWRVTVPKDGRLPFDNLHPAVLQWKTDHPALALAPSEVRLTKLTVTHPNAAALADLLGLSDPRIVFQSGEPSLAAEFATPDGPRMLA